MPFNNLKKQFILCITIFANVITSHACSCIWQSLDTIYNNAHSVFTGELVSIKFIYYKNVALHGKNEWIPADTLDVTQKRIDSSGFNLCFPAMQIARFKVTHMYKGTIPPDSIITIVTGMGGGDCGVNFYSYHHFIHPDSSIFIDPSKVKPVQFLVFAFPQRPEEIDDRFYPFAHKGNGLYTSDCHRTALADSNSIKDMEALMKRRKKQ
jgi:hypothetical protein